MNTPKKYVLDHKGKLYNKFFEDISAIPRNSFDEKAVSDYLVAFAEERGLWHYRDHQWNVIIKKPASPGYEDHAPVLIQAHTDMICVKEPGSTHDFTKDPLDLYVEDGCLKARGTSLGADNGFGVAHILAILDDKSLKHPPLEALFSVQEENGLGGVRDLDYSHFSARRLIFTDAIFEGCQYRSTAGAIGGDFIRRIQWESGKMPALKFTVRDTTAGHAALNVRNDACNAIKTVVRFLYAIREKCPIRLADIKGGTERNNIPSHCSAVFGYEPGDHAAIEEIVRQTKENVFFEYSFTDPELKIDFDKAGEVSRYLTADQSDAALNLLYALPTGVYCRSQKYDDAVFASRNTGLIRLEGDKLIIGNMFRGVIASQVEDMKKQVQAIAASFDTYYNELYRYPGHIAPEVSPLADLWAAVYREKTGKELTVVDMHGGIEAGTIINNLGGRDKMDVVGLGVLHTLIHTPEESLDLASFDRGYRYFTAMLERL